MAPVQNPATLRNPPLLILATSNVLSPYFHFFTLPAAKRTSKGYYLALQAHAIISLLLLAYEASSSLALYCIIFLSFYPFSLHSIAACSSLSLSLSSLSLSLSLSPLRCNVVGQQQKQQKSLLAFTRTRLLRILCYVQFETHTCGSDSVHRSM